MLNDYIATLRPSSNQHHSRPQRLCSCCREPGHTINICDDPRISTLYDESMRMFGQYSESMYISYLSYVDFNVIKALCLRIGMARTVSFITSRSRCTILLITYFRHMSEDQSQDTVFIPFTSEPDQENKNIKIDIRINPELFENVCECPVCNTTEKENMIRYDCEHYMCSDCFIGTVNAMQKLKYPTCSLCRNQVSNFIIKTEETYTKITTALIANPKK